MGCGGPHHPKDKKKIQEPYRENLVSTNCKYAKNLCQGCGCK